MPRCFRIVGLHHPTKMQLKGAVCGFTPAINTHPVLTSSPPQLTSTPIKYVISVLFFKENLFFLKSCFEIDWLRSCESKPLPLRGGNSSPKWVKSWWCQDSDWQSPDNTGSTLRFFTVVSLHTGHTACYLQVFLPARSEKKKTHHWGSASTRCTSL